MRYTWIDEYLLKKAGVTKDIQKDWNWIRYQIGGKMFAAVCLDDNNKPYYITLKLEPLKGDFLRKQYKDIIPGYYMNKTHWNSIKSDGEVPDDLLKDLLDQSYQLVLGGFSKKKQQEILGEAEKVNLETDFINLTAENLQSEHLCCIIRSKKLHPGIEAKRQWLSERLSEGHVFRKLNAKATVFIEYAPLETAWVPIIGDNYYYVYCLWTYGSYKGKGYGKSLMEYCLADAKAKGKSGVCMLGAKKQKGWLTDQAFAKKFGFEVVDTTDNGYELLALSFDGTTPKFAQNAKKEKIESQELTIYYDMQCPYVYQNIELIKAYCKQNEVPVNLIQIDTLQKAKELPCVFNNWAVFYKGKFETVNLVLDVEHLKRILKK